ncbi:LCP family protein [Agromyces sp. Marseille-P2726]|uniref:LCP family protein n=1 Tax=Agromyces sp. Marseille-P2726 TaxID=2709132 RepID=UPI00156D58A2|nr:LCP family protein [Agromyces sp. Marseille-P2726]
MSGPSGVDPPVAYAFPPRHGRLRRHGAWVTVAKAVASVVAVVAVSGAAVAAYAALDLLSTVKPPVVLESEVVLEDVPDIGAMEGGLNFLLVGSDKRTVDGAFGDPDIDSAVLNDVTMLLHISEDHSHVEVISFPRDMLVSVPECPNPSDPQGEPLPALVEERMNGVLSWGGFGCVAATIEQLTGVTIPVGGIVEFYGVAALSEAVGGVEVCVAERIDDEYTDLHLDPGVHSLSGMQALQFLRVRHGVGDGSDLGRISNQQVFLSALVRKIRSDGTLADPLKLYSIAKAALSNMTLSSALQDPARLMAIARTLQDIDLSRIVFIQYPTAYLGDFSAVVPSESAAAVNAALVADVPVQLDPTATDLSDYGTVPDSSSPPTTGTEPSPAGEDGASDAPTPTPTAPAVPPSLLPTDVTGQPADQVRCSRANSGW